MFLRPKTKKKPKKAYETLGLQKSLPTLAFYVWRPQKSLRNAWITHHLPGSISRGGVAKSFCCKSSFAFSGSLSVGSVEWFFLFRFSFSGPFSGFPFPVCLRRALVSWNRIGRREDGVRSGEGRCEYQRRLALSSRRALLSLWRREQRSDCAPGPH